MKILVWGTSDRYKVRIVFSILSKSIFLFINNYHFAFKVTFLRLRHLYQCIFQSPKHIWKTLFDIVHSSCSNFSFIFSIVEKRFRFVGFLSLGKRMHDCLVEAWFRFCFQPKIHAQALMSELLPYHGANSIIGFSTILRNGLITSM